MRLDGISAVGVGLGLAEGLEGVLVAEQRGAKADPRDPLAGLGVEDSPRDRHGPRGWHPEPGDGPRADFDLLRFLAPRAGILTEDREDLIAAGWHVVEPEGAIGIGRDGLEVIHLERG